MGRLTATTDDDYSRSHDYRSKGRISEKYEGRKESEVKGNEVKVEDCIERSFIICFPGHASGGHDMPRSLSPQWRIGTVNSGLG